MRLVFLTALVMVAFAANSVLNRAAVDGGHADATAFALVRVLAGAVMLAMLMTLRARALPLFELRRIGGVLGLSAYMIGFSLAYLTLPAGLGALILFGTVQVLLFAHAAQDGGVRMRQAAGGAVAFLGLALALWPQDEVQGAGAGSLLMVVAGIGWAVYTLSARGARDAIGATAANFILSLPLMAMLLLTPGLGMTAIGWALAILSGAVASALGYALWYAVLPLLRPTTAAVVQLSVPVIAIAMGAAFLGEPVTLRVALAAGLVLGGIGWAITSGSVREGRS